MKLNRWLYLLVLCTFAFSSGSGFAAATVRINEFVANNGNGYRDEDLDYSDWIELHNFGGQSVSLAGWYLTDDEDDFTKWPFPNVSIPANGYLIVHASSKNRTTPRLHTNFGLSEAGEYLALIDNTGAPVSALNFPQQLLNVSYGYDSTGKLVYFTAPTPGAQNGVGGDLVGDTTFSHDRGFYDAPFDLSILTATPAATIRYTTNGVPPTSTTGFVYTDPIRISGTTTIRAAAYKTGLLPSNVDTQTYLFLDDVIRQAPTGAAPPGWPAARVRRTARRRSRGPSRPPHSWPPPLTINPP